MSYSPKRLENALWGAFIADSTSVTQNMDLLHMCLQNTSKSKKYSQDECLSKLIKNMSDLNKSTTNKLMQLLSDILNGCELRSCLKKYTSLDLDYLMREYTPDEIYHSNPTTNFSSENS